MARKEVGRIPWFTQSHHDPLVPDETYKGSSRLTYFIYSLGIFLAQLIPAHSEKPVHSHAPSLGSGLSKLW